MPGTWTLSGPLPPSRENTFIRLLYRSIPSFQELLLPSAVPSMHNAARAAVCAHCRVYSGLRATRAFACRCRCHTPPPLRAHAPHALPLTHTCLAFSHLPHLPRFCALPALPHALPFPPATTTHLPALAIRHLALYRILRCRRTSLVSPYLYTPSPAYR